MWHWHGSIIWGVNIIMVDEKCLQCVYFNGDGECWSRKNVAKYGKYGCDFRPIESCVSSEFGDVNGR